MVSIGIKNNVADLIIFNTLLLCGGLALACQINMESWISIGYVDSAGGPSPSGASGTVVSSTLYH